EYTEGKEEVEIDDFTCFVYTPPMIAAEKLRAICQQMEGYHLVKHPRARARDFYDIHSVVDKIALDVGSESFLELVRQMFEVKKVPLSFLGDIKDQYDFHEGNWKEVQAAIGDMNAEFQFYFDFVVGLTKKLEPLWVE